MKIALLSMVMIGSQLVIPVSDRIPKLDVEATCKATVAADNAANLVLSQDYAGCMRDENEAQAQLAGVWSTSPDSVRNTCVDEATAGGNDSYVDLLVCMQMAGWASTPAAPLKGASKVRNKK
ncbi:hypothetical protein [Bradyrhizobium ivorense]|uniref:hypothetical protein n=1 Tax=Bradyrhizobium ivorense TaxID=2511166 RepID=UPI0010B3B0C6|nr:hypothetical protein [Bradyrhizobium ivorense]MCC8938034.1 hypothetical protein [Bradyrhizobium ivorense]VIO70952.1 hypothetical protein CI41S_26220 [Bradyrhizobium ivorense]